MVGLGLGAAGLFGCPVSSSDDCEALGTCTTSGTETTGTTTEVPPECSSFDPGSVVGESCGVFVVPQGDPDMNGDGTKKNPFGTLAAGIEGAQGKPVYVCAGTLAESLVVSGAARIFGGFACDTWAYSGEKPLLEAPADQIAVTVEDAAIFRAQDLSIVAQSAQADGASSIGIFAKAGTSVELVRVDVTAGDGADGADGETPVGDVPASENGGAGADGCVSADPTSGGKGGKSMCGDVAPNGGIGGQGTDADGGDGSDGQPVSATDGLGGAGATAVVTCKLGTKGADGEAGPHGAGGTAPGTLAITGFVGAAGADGAIGQPGQGGGGGGGGKKCGDGTAGPGGGGGGAGACGGAGGKGGQGGGASIGIAAVDGASLLLADVVITTGKGGIGGAGGGPQGGGKGGDPGDPGAGSTTACNGGFGGFGGSGGSGGGGRGGHSLGIAFGAGMPTLGASVSILTGAAGEAGAGGLGNETDGAGDPGVAMETMELPAELP